MGRRLGWMGAAALAACVEVPDGPGVRRPWPIVDPPEDTSSGGTPAPGAPTEVAPATWSVSGPKPCEDPSLRDEAKFDLRLSAYEIEKEIWLWGGGVVVADLTGDGREDIVLPGYWTTLFYLGVEGGFAYQPDMFAGMPLDMASGGSAADYDADGDLDLLVTRFEQRNVLLRNEGGTFTDVTVEAGLTDGTNSSVASSWGDYDGDGDLDLFIGAYGFVDDSGVPHKQFEPADPNFLYANDGDGTFTDLSATMPAAFHDGYTLAGGWQDYDGDMRPDLYVVNDFGVAYPNALFWNRGGGVLEQDHNASGLDVSLTSMGLAIGDLNGDDLPDLVQPAWATISLLESNPSFDLWTEWSMARDLSYDVEAGQKIGWGADFVDMDNDADLDLPIAFGWLDSNYDAPLAQPHALYLQQDDGNFVDAATEWGVADTFPGRGFVATDVNDDGWLDLIKRDLAGPTRLYTSRCGPEAWLRVRLRAPPPNTFGVGARVRVFTGDGHQTRWVHAGGTNHASAGPPEIHVGLGDLEVVDSVEITWPDGAVSVLRDLAARQIVDVQRLPELSDRD